MKTVKVLYKFVDGAHFFVSNDEASVGLCVAHESLEKAFDAVEIQLTKLFRKNHGIEAEFSPSMSSMAFAAWVKNQQAENASMPSPGVAGQVPWMKNEPAIAA
ncbi:MAG: hypothetical protein H5U21_00490 [Porphyrobacter sp.]|nr:hypothetical protein [Porphyrobacter sp.]